MTETPALGDLIRESRLALGYSLGQLATKVGRSGATVRAWERGEAVPNGESRAALEEVLGIEPGGLEALLASEVPEPDDAATDAPAGSDEMPPGADEASEEDSLPQDVAAEPTDDVADGADDADDEGVEHDDSTAAAGAGGLAAVAVAAEPDGSVVESAEDGASDTSDEDEPSGEAPDGSPAELPIVPLVTDGTPVEDDEVASDSDDDDTLEGVAAATPFEVDSDLIDEPTEAVVVPVVAASTGVATQTRSVVTVSEPRERRSRNPIRAFFDPEKRWLYWLRGLLTIAVAVVLVYVLVWAAGELFDALGQVLDSIEPTEVDDGSIDALGRFRTQI